MFVNIVLLFVILGVFTLLSNSLKIDFNEGLARSTNRAESMLQFHSPQIGARSGIFEEIHPSHASRSDFVKLGASDPTQYHEVTFAIKQNNLDKLEATLRDVSNPTSSNYGKFLNRQQISSITSHQDSSRFVADGLSKIGVEILKTSQYGEYITARAPISLWNTFFSTTFHTYDQAEGVGKFFRSSSYSLPSAFAPHVAHVFNTVQLPPHPQKRSNEPKLIGSASSVTTPALLFNYYDINDRTGFPSNSQSCWESLNQSTSPSDLTLFQETFNLPIESLGGVYGGHVNEAACTGPDGPNNCAEASLDIQYMMAVSPGSRTVYWYDNSTDFLLTWATEVSGMADPPLVFSISYGEDEQYLSKGYTQIFDIEAMKLGIMGVTITASAGDDGAQSPMTRTSSAVCGYSPSYPASSPYVTAVGATQGPEAGLPETVCMGDAGGVITSGGGFSFRYPRPDWQDVIVNDYLANSGADVYPGFNRQGRGYPDVTLMGHNYAVFLGGNQYMLSGTSASSPVFAGMVALVNAARLAAGKPSLGWINPTLYQTYQSFTKDIKAGNNKCNVEGLVCCEQGYYAVAGWDPTSGLGSVNYTAFKDTFMKLTDMPLTPTPTLDTTTKPTFKPTQAPTQTGGWLQQFVYDKPGCGGTPDQAVNLVYQWPTQSCMYNYDSKHAITGSKLITCSASSGGHAYIHYFDSIDCNFDTLLLRQTINVGCASEVNLMEGHPMYSTQVKCVDSAIQAPDFPVPDTNTPYSVYTTYNDQGCDSKDIAFMTMIKEHTCLDATRYGKPTWYTLHYPLVTLYSDEFCTNELSTNNLLTECSPVFQSEPAPEAIPSGPDAIPSPKSVAKKMDLENQVPNSGINYYYTTYYDIAFVAYSSAAGIWSHVGPTQAPTESPVSSSSSSSASSSLSGGAVAGVIVAIVIVVGAVGAYCYFKKSGPSSGLNQGLASAEDSTPYNPMQGKA